VVIPQRHHQYNTFLKGITNGTQASLRGEIGSILSGGNPISTVVIGDTAVLVAVHIVLRVLNGLAILRVELLYLRQRATIGSITRDELSGHLNWLARVNLEIRTWTKKAFVSKTVRLDVATILVAHTLESVRTVVATVSARAPSLLTLAACMHGESA